MLKRFRTALSPKRPAKPATKSAAEGKRPASARAKTSTRSDTRRVAASFSEPSGTGRWLRGIHFSAFSLVMMGVLVLAVVILAPTVQAVFAQQQQIADQQKVVNELSAKVDGLTEERARWNDPSYIRAQARDRLYYVMPGEVSYLVIDDRPPAAAAAEEPVSSKPQQSHSNWVSSLFGSFMGAGLTEATPQQLSGTPAPTPTPTPTPGGTK